MNFIVNKLNSINPRRLFLFGLIFLFMGIRVFALDTIEIISEPWALKIDSANGNWIELKRNNKIIYNNSQSLPTVELLDKKTNKKEIPSFNLESYKFDDKSNTLILILSNNKWEVHDIVIFSPAGKANRIQRRVKFTTKSKRPEKFYKVILSGYLPLTGKYFLPGTFFYDTKVNWGYDSTLYEEKNTSLNRMGMMTQLPFQVGKGTGQYVKAIIAESQKDQSEVFFIDTRMDGGELTFTRLDQSVKVQYAFNAAGWCEPSEFQTVGDSWLEVFDGGAEKALKQVMPELLNDIGLGVPDDIPAWVYDASLFGFKINRFANETIAGISDEFIERITNIGCNTTWLLPVQYGTVAYCPFDYYEVEPKIGNWNDYVCFVNKLHNVGVKVLQDIVPHGDGQRAAMYRGNLITDLLFSEEGHILTGRAFDFNSPDWIKYIANVATFYMEKGIDGFRVDAPYGGMMFNWRRKGFPAKCPGFISDISQKKPFRASLEKHWNDSLRELGGEIPSLPYQRASLTQSCGGLNMVEGIRSSMKAIKPDSALLLETCGLPFTAAGAMTYDLYFPLLELKLKQLSSEEFVERLTFWLEEQKLTESPDALRLRYLSCNDNRDVTLLNGLNAHKALISLSFLVRGIPLYYNDAPKGTAQHYRHLNMVRNQLIALRRGKAFYDLHLTSDKRIFSVLRKDAINSVVGLINFSPDFVECRVAIPDKFMNLSKQEKIILQDALSGLKIAEGFINDFKSVKVRLKPWQTIILAGFPASTNSLLKYMSTEKTQEKSEKNKHIPRILTETATFYQVKASHYSAVIDKQTGQLKQFSDENGNELICNSDILFPPSKLKRSPVVNITNNVDADGSPTVTTSITLPDGKTVMLKYVFKSDRIDMSIENLSLLEPMLCLPIADFSEYQIDCASGLHDEFVPSVRSESESLNHVRVSRFPVNNKLFWSSSLTPLDFNRPEIRFLNAESSQGGLEVVFANTDGCHAPDLKLYSDVAKDKRMKLFVIPNNIVQFSLCPNAQRKASVHGIPFVRSDVSIVNQSKGWVICNKYYSLFINRCGGVIEWIKSADGTIIFNKQDVFSKGIEGASLYASSSSDFDTESKIWFEGGMIRLSFSSELRNKTTKGITKYPIQVRNEYAFDSSSNFTMLTGIKAIAPVSQNSSIDWRCHVGNGLNFTSITPDKFDVIETNAKNKLSIILQAKNTTNKIKAVCEKSSLKFVLLGGQDSHLEPQHWKQFQLLFSIPQGNSFAPKEIPWIHDQNLEYDGGFEQRGARYSLNLNNNIPYYPYQRTDGFFWKALYSSYPEFGSGINGSVALRMNFVDPYYQQNLAPTVLMPGKYSLSFNIMGEKLEKRSSKPPHGNNTVQVEINYFTLDGKCKKETKTFKYLSSFDWKKENVSFDISKEGTAPFVIFRAKPNYTGSFLIDNIFLDKQR